MSIFSRSELSSIVTVVGVIAAIQAIVFFIYNQAKSRKYNNEMQRAEIQKLRNSLEKKIYDLTERLLSKEDRWKDVNHLLIESKSNLNAPDFSIKKVKKNSFLESAGIVSSDYGIDHNLVFVITPFNDLYSKDYHHVKEICQDVGLQCMRGDEEHIDGDILGHILKKMVKARIVIANINGRNPNVFYELGLAHALEKPTIITSKKLEDIPFDLRTRQVVLYKDYNDLQTQLNKALLKISLKKTPNKSLNTDSLKLAG